MCITRCSNNYGYYQFPEKVIPLFVTNLIDGLTVPLYGEGLNVRDWLHVDDHCNGIALVLAGGRPGEVYNIGGGTELTNKELTGLLLEATGQDWDAVVRVEDRKGHDLRYSVDISKINSEARLHAAGAVRAGAGRDGRLVPQQSRLVGAVEGARRAGPQELDSQKVQMRLSDSRRRRSARHRAARCWRGQKGIPFSGYTSAELDISDEGRSATRSAGSPGGIPTALSSTPPPTPLWTRRRATSTARSR